MTGLGAPLWTVLGALALLLLLTWMHLRFWVRRLTREQPYAETVRVATPDGCAFDLRRLPASDVQEPTGDSATQPPVLLVHGIAVNHRNVDAWADWSLARRLARHGRDVWLLTLRSGRHDLTRRERATVRFQAMVAHDLPLAVAEVLRRTGAKNLDYVGFSMGGMLLYAAIGRSLPQDQVRRVAIVGSPGRVMTALPVPRWVSHLPLPTVPLRLFARLFAFSSEWLTTPIHTTILNLKNTETGLTRHAMVDGVVDIPGPLLREFAVWAATGGMVVLDGQPVLDGLRKIAIPAHFFVGAGDRLGPPKSVRLAFDAWGADSGAAKQFTVFGREAGHAADYGHIDLMLGKVAPTEVFPHVVDFLCAPAVLPQASA